MATCDELAHQVQELENLLRKTSNEEKRQEILDQISDLNTQQQNQGCLGPPQQTPWAVLLCKVNDDQSETPVPNFRTVCERFFTTPGAGFNAVQFFSDMSHGSVDLSGSQVFGWFTLDVDTEYVHRLGQDIQDHVMTLAKQAARGVLDQNMSFGVVLIMNVATGWAQGTYNTAGGYPGPGVFVDWRRVDGRNLDGSLGPRATGGGNGTEVFGQEMGHGYGLGHSRRDGSEADYQDRWDIMSTANANSVPDPDYCARGPGLNAWNMRGRGWLDESRVWKAQGYVFDQILELRPLHRPDLNGLLAAELPPNDGVGGHGRYLVEFRVKEAWDAGIPRSAVLVHRYLTATQDNDGWPHSYIMSGTNGNQDLAEGDVFAPGVDGGIAPRVEVQKINENDKTATVRLSSTPQVTIQGSETISVTLADLDPANPVLEEGPYSVDPVGLQAPLKIQWRGAGGATVVDSTASSTLIDFDMSGQILPHGHKEFEVSVNVTDQLGVSVSAQARIFIRVIDRGKGGG